ncbi:MAG TPA: 23S rRNA (guanosine(2251)-2'-O)-methyltransferase RlmB [Melioribacteraceae bacterium]|nr:23S rRNA (guanosine(2251)-2'-O)-methyltransferase RlmB [Melioribacteraceae bacterium]
MSKIYGRIPVLEALKSGTNIQAIYLANGVKGEIITEISNIAKQRNIKISSVYPSKIEEVLGRVNSQGVYALLQDFSFSNYDQIIKKAKTKKYPLVLILDSIQDPHNLGAILRTAEASGVDGVFITMHNSAKITETVEKTSAGAIFHLNICLVNNVNNLIKDLKKDGFWVCGSMLDDESKNYTKVDYKTQIALVLGNEGKGIRKLVSENCDHLVKIPMLGKIESLNVSVSAGILLFEVIRQRENF